MYIPLKVLVFAATTAAERYMFSFGDSYSATAFKINGTKPSDSNVLGNPPFPGNTFSGGINWVGQFASTPPKTYAYNFAAGGATVDNNYAPSAQQRDFVTQRKTFTEYLYTNDHGFAQWNGENSLFAVWFGINDVLHTYQGTTSAQRQAINTQIQNSLFYQLGQLYSNGARRFLLLTAPPIDRTPYVMDRGDSDDTIVKGQIVNWNIQLRNHSDYFVENHPLASLAVMNTSAVISPILDDPQAYGAQNCVDDSGSPCLWWDRLHPGIIIQKAIGNKAFSTAQQSLGF